MTCRKSYFFEGFNSVSIYCLNFFIKSFLFSKISFFSSTDKESDKWNLHFSFLYLWPVFECRWIWYVFTSPNRSGSLHGSARSVHIMLSTQLAYSSMLDLVSLGEFKIHINQWTCGLPLTWNSTRLDNNLFSQENH